MRMIKKSGQSVAEYAIVFGVVAAAIIGMQIFVKRGLQAKEHDIVAHLASVAGSVTGTTGTGAIGTKLQYEPYYASSDYTVKQGTDSKEEMKTGGEVTRNTTRGDTTRTGFATTGTDTSAGNW